MGGAMDPGTLEARLTALEAAVQSLVAAQGVSLSTGPADHPFIGERPRPDLSEDTLASELDFETSNEFSEKGDAEAEHP
jgi:hypothetical protein